MSSYLYRWGRFAATHAWAVIGAWLVAAILVVGASAGLGEEMEDSFVVPGLDSQAAVDLLQASGATGGGITAQVVMTPIDDTTTFTTSTTAQAELDAVQATVASLPNVLGTTTEVSPDGVVAIVRVQYPTVDALTTADLDGLKAAVADARPGSPLQIEAGGDLFFTFEETAAATGELIGIIAAMVILLIAFGSIIAMGLPIGIALFGLAVGVSSMALVTRIIDIPSWAPQMATMIALGVGIDYALFLVTRHREFLAQGLPVPEAAGRAVATAGQTVIFAGGTVVIAVLGMAFAGIPFMTAAGIATSIIVLAMVTASVTLLPALLGIAGQRINRRGHRGIVTSDTHHVSARWMRWGVACLPQLVGLPHRDDDPAGRAGRARARPADGLPRRGLAAAVPHRAARLRPRRRWVRSRHQRPAPDRDRRRPRTRPWSSRCARPSPPIPASPPSPPPRSTPRPVSRRCSPSRPPHPRTAPRSPRSSGSARRRSRRCSPGAPASAHIGGQTASWADIGHKVRDRLPLFIAGVILMSCVLLLFVFRSILVPVKAAVMTLLSIGAAYGVIVMVFQWGWGMSIIGLESTVPVIPFIPMFMFAVLFGLSMDYEVFLLSRIREEYLRTGDTGASIVRGIASSARVITSAALIMICVYLGFVLGEDPATKMMGLGLATAILIDATLVRMVLVPAAMTLMGRANWWLPAWLDRLLPTIDIEGATHEAIDLTVPAEESSLPQRRASRT